MSENMSRFSLRHHAQPKMANSFYLAKITDLGVGPSRHGGWPMVQMILQPEGSAGNTYLWRASLTEDDIQKLSQVHKAIGLPTPSLPRLKSGADILDKDDYLGELVLARLVPDQHQGKWRSIITEIRPVSQASHFAAVVVDEEPTL